MTSLKKKFIVYFLILWMLSCNTNENPSSSSNIPQQTKTIFGLYSYYLTLGEEADCESLKRSIRLNEDSTFVMKEYCNDNYMSNFRPLIKTGIFRMENPTIFNFMSSDKTTFKMKMLNDSTFEITPRSDDTYPYQRDTIKVEKI